MHFFQVILLALFLARAQQITQGISTYAEVRKFPLPVAGIGGPSIGGPPFQLSGPGGPPFGLGGPSFGPSGPAFGLGGPPFGPGGLPLAPAATAVIQEPTSAFISKSVVGTSSNCPSGAPALRPCDAKRPWPQCPPSSYCYAVNTVDIGPYFCCPVWSTLGALWRPAAPFYPYYPPIPYNWLPIIQATANWGAKVNPFAGSAGQFGPLLELLHAKNAKMKEVHKIANNSSSGEEFQSSEEAPVQNKLNMQISA